MAERQAAKRGMVIITHVFVDVVDRDPEDVASEFKDGADNALSAFPGAEVWGVDVARIRDATDEEKSSWLSE